MADTPTVFQERIYKTFEIKQSAWLDDIMIMTKGRHYEYTTLTTEKEGHAQLTMKTARRLKCDVSNSFP